MKRTAAFLALVVLVAGMARVGWTARARLGPQSPTGRYVILLADAPIATYRGGIPGLAATSPATTSMVRLNPHASASQAYFDYLSQQQEEVRQTLSRRLGREVVWIYQYRWVLNGVAVRLTPAEAAIAETLPGVRAVAPDGIRQLLTDRGPGWIGAESQWGPRNSADCTVDGGRCGEGIIIGLLDSGINHGHPSFADIADDGYDHRNPFGSGVYKGECINTPSLCNDKLIGMYDYTGAGVEDDDGHGSHTASTAAGNFLYDIEYIAPTMTITTNISGVAPHANIISYRVCDNNQCLLTDAAAGIDQAVADGVHVLNYSAGGNSSLSPWNPFNLDTQAFLDAREAGVFVAAATGNSGPDPGTVGSPAYAPWIMAVGSHAHDRAFSNALVSMTTDQGTTLADIEGRSVTAGYGPAAIVYAGDYGNPYCDSGIWPANQFHGEIVVCDRGQVKRRDKGQNVKDAGGGGMVLANTENEGYGIVSDPHVIPAVHITYLDAVALKDWLNNGDTGHTAVISGTVRVVDGAKYGDIMAQSSSRGPNSTASTQKIIKPDIIGPGVDILAAVADDGDPSNGPDFDVYNGTSMASPHLAGAAALLIQAHPEWSPAEVQSALMSTAKIQGIRKEDRTTPADVFDMGAGRVDLTVASDAGFILHITRQEYENANPSGGGDPSSLNMPSLATDEFDNAWTWTRTLKATRPGNWEISFDLPAGMSMTASPASFSFTAAGETQTITFTAHGYGFQPDQWQFAQVHFTEATAASPDAHFPIAVKATCPVPDAPTVASSLNGVDVELTWDATSDSYEVWRSETPYFTPGDATAQQLTPDGYTQTAYTDVGAGDGQANYYYKVIARNTCGGASSDQHDHDGVFSFALVPGQ